MSTLKRPTTSVLPAPKRRALMPVSQLATPPTTPEKERTIDLHLTKPGRALNFGRTSVYSHAKALFQRGAKNTAGPFLVGRETEAATFDKFLRDALVNKKCTSIYISGPPGTGKTAQTTQILDLYCAGSLGPVYNIHQTRTRVLKVNCMTVSKPEHIFHEIHTALVGSSLGRRKTFDDLYAALTQPSDTQLLVVVIDEMDHLITQDQQVLFQLFHCASSLKSATLKTKLVLVGISNALDLTDKFLPRLRSNGFNPASLQFLPYSAEQIKRVVVAKLQSLVEHDKENTQSAVPLMHPGAIQMCCKKCATVTGDLRKAFDICYKSIEHVEQQAKKRADFDSLTLDTAPKVLISHVAKVCTDTFGDSSQQKIQNLNLLQKVVLATLLNMERNTLTAASLTVNELYEYYCKHTLVAVENLLGKIKKGEFLEIISALESASAITFATGRSLSQLNNGNKQLRSNVAYVDMLKCSEEIGILARVLHNIH